MRENCAERGAACGYCWARDAYGVEEVRDDFRWRRSEHAMALRVQNARQRRLRALGGQRHVRPNHQDGRGQQRREEEQEKGRADKRGSHLGARRRRFSPRTTGQESGRRQRFAVSTARLSILSGALRSGTDVTVNCSCIVPSAPRRRIVRTGCDGGRDSNVRGEPRSYHPSTGQFAKAAENREIRCTHTDCTHAAVDSTVGSMEQQANKSRRR